MALKPREDVITNPKQGYQWPQDGHVNVSTKNTFRRRRKKLYVIEKHFAIVKYQVKTGRCKP